MSQLWVPGFAGPLDDLLKRLHRRIEEYAEEAGVDEAHVEVELVDGARYSVASLVSEPGYGFVTIRPHPDEGVPAEVIVPIGTIKRIELSKAADERGQLGFSLPSA